MSDVKIIKPQEGFQEQFVRSNVDVVFGGGVLNPQPLDAKIMTPDGYILMRDIKAGDVICNPLGGTQRVNLVIDKGVQPCVEFTLLDGRKVQSALSHHWKVIDSMGIESDIDASEIINNLKNGFDCFLPYTKPDKGIELIASYSLIGDKEVRCINVSGDEHIYLTDGCVITCNCGKSFGAILSLAEPSLDPNFRACFTRRTFGELKSGGGLVDDLELAFKGYIDIKKSENPRGTFKSGAFVEMRQINDENPKKITEQWKGSQYDLIYMDELTSYEFSTFKYLLSRNRGKGKWTGKFRGTTNPEKDCWVRTFIDWYVGYDGQIRADRNGVVRYFYLQDETVDDVVWGDSKEEVYHKCKIDIDKKLASLGEGFTYHNLIKSFTFYLGRMSENKASIANNMDYAGSVAAVGGKQGKQLIEGNWNVSLKDDSECPIPYNVAESVFNNDPRINGDKWITADLADVGTDNTVIFVWNGLHIMDYLILPKSTSKMNADTILRIAEKYDIPDTHIIFDATRAEYIKGYIEDALGFLSCKKAYGKYGRAYYNVKDMCYARLIEVIHNGMLSFDDNIARSQYIHQKIKQPIMIRTEFIEECSVVRFRDIQSGKRTLFNKKEMNKHLGKDRSMDLLDAIAMRMLPFAFCEYGDEITRFTADNDDSMESSTLRQSIYEDTFWS